MIELSLKFFVENTLQVMLCSLPSESVYLIIEDAKFFYLVKMWSARFLLLLISNLWEWELRWVETGVKVSHYLETLLKAQVVEGKARQCRKAAYTGWTSSQPQLWSWSLTLLGASVERTLPSPGLLTTGVWLSCFVQPTVTSDYFQCHGLQHARASCPSLSPRVCSNARPSSRWCHPTISSSVSSFSSCLQSFPASGSFPMSQLLASGGQNIGASASASVPFHWFPLGLTGLISLPSLGLSRVFCCTAVLWNFHPPQLAGRAGAGTLESPQTFVCLWFTMLRLGLGGEEGR